MTKKEKQTLEHVEALIKDVEKTWTKDKCKGYYPSCANCQGQLLLGMLYEYKDILEME